MCGIAGLVKSDVILTDDLAAVERMMHAQFHRGPDGSGVQEVDRCVLGHLRLSIIDLSTAGAQPMSNENGSVWITYNGEIYNFSELRTELVENGHKFRSNTDTEVILHGYEQWGIEGLLGRLRGMFAFGLFDQKTGLILARDRLGIKPLYYAEQPEALLFASEVKALLKSGRIRRETNTDALAGFLIAGSVPAPLTINKGISCLEPGHYLRYQAGVARIRRYWDVEFGSSENKPAKEFGEELTHCVRGHLMSDVPLGVFLSGGVDSAALVALASRSRNTELRTLTVVFEEKEWNEGNAAGDIARHFGTKHQEVPVSAADFHRELPSVIQSMDQPTNDGVNTYFVSKAAREAGLKVVLSGLGGDEVFWGYGHYQKIGGALHWLNRIPAPARRAAIHGASTLGQVSGREKWMRTEYLKQKPTGQQLYFTMRGFFAPKQVAKLLGLSTKQAAEAAEKFVGMPAENGAQGFNYMEFKRYLHDQLLRDSDVFSMAHSLELRVPFLDHRIVEYAASVRPEAKLANGVNKPLLVKAVDDPILFQAGERRKQGFSFPMDRWMKQYSGELEEMSQTADCVDRAEAKSLWQQFRGGRLHWSRAWALTVLGARN